MSDKHKTKDHAKVRADLEEMDIRPELYLNGTSSQLPASAVNLTKPEKKELCDFFRSVKVPSGYSSNVRKLVSCNSFLTVSCNSFLQFMIYLTRSDI